MFMPFYHYRSSECLEKAVSVAEKDLNLALIGYCGYFHFSSWYSFVGNLRKSYGIQPTPQEPRAVRPWF